MSLEWDLFKQKYGDRWNYFMPPQGTPVSYIQNTSALNTFVPNNEATQVLFQTTPISAGLGEVLVITHYSCLANAAVVNPYWPGFLPTPLPAYAFQGRFAWTVLITTAPNNDRSLIGDVTYQNTTPFPAGTIQNGKSLFKEYGTGSGDPSILIMPGQAAYIAIYALPADRGADPPPADSPQIVLTAELVGYRVPIPNYVAMGPKPDPTQPRKVSQEIPGRRVYGGGK